MTTIWTVESRVRAVAACDNENPREVFDVSGVVEEPDGLFSILHHTRITFACNDKQSANALATLLNSQLVVGITVDPL